MAASAEGAKDVYVRFGYSECENGFSTPQQRMFQHYRNFGLPIEADERPLPNTGTATPEISIDLFHLLAKVTLKYSIKALRNLNIKSRKEYFRNVLIEVYGEGQFSSFHNFFAPLPEIDENLRNEFFGNTFSYLFKFSNYDEECTVFVHHQAKISNRVVLRVLKLTESKGKCKLKIVPRTLKNWNSVVLLA